MGQKVNPVGMRLQVNRTWDSRWYADDKDYGNLLLEDLKIRDFIHKEAKQAGVSRDALVRKGQVGHSLVNLFAADQRRHQIQLLGRGAKHLGLRKRLILRHAARIVFLTHDDYFLLAFLSAACP